MNPQVVVQEQLDAYNARDLARFVALFAPDVKVYRPPVAEPKLQGREALATHYASNRFNNAGLHAELLNRIVLGNKVFDHERIHGVRPAPFEMVAVYEVLGGQIQTVFFFDPA